MAKQDEIESRIERVKEIIERLESGEASSEEADQLFEEGQEKLDEVRDILHRGEGEIIELPE